MKLMLLACYFYDSILWKSNLDVIRNGNYCFFYINKSIKQKITEQMNGNQYIRWQDFIQGVHVDHIQPVKIFKLNSVALNIKIYTRKINVVKIWDNSL